MEKPDLLGLLITSGESVWQNFPGKIGFLSLNFGTFSLIMVKSSAKIQPMDHISIAGP
jgi:hypothetical protein